MPRTQHTGGDVEEGTEMQSIPTGYSKSKLHEDDIARLQELVDLSDYGRFTDKTRASMTEHVGKFTAMMTDLDASLEERRQAREAIEVVITNGKRVKSGYEHASANLASKAGDHSQSNPVARMAQTPETNNDEAAQDMINLLASLPFDDMGLDLQEECQVAFDMVQSNDPTASQRVQALMAKLRNLPATRASGSQSGSGHLSQGSG